MSTCRVCAANATVNMTGEECKRATFEILDALVATRKRVSCVTRGYIAGKVSLEVHPAVFQMVLEGLASAHIECTVIGEVIRLPMHDAEIRRGRS